MPGRPRSAQHAAEDVLWEAVAFRGEARLSGARRVTGRRRDGGGGRVLNGEEILGRLLTSLEPLAEPGVELGADTNLVTTLKLDSQKFLDLLLDVEDAFDVLVPIAAVVDVPTASDLAAVIQRLLPGD